MRIALASCLLSLAATLPAHADRLAHLNHRLAGRIIDHTHNHGSDHRFFSELLQQSRDMYVYLPPGYDCRRSYPFVLWMHGAFGDEHAFLTRDIARVDRMIQKGCHPPMIIACVDATCAGENRLTAQHTFFVNGIAGPFEDHLLTEVMPFLFAHYAISVDREARAVVGQSAGAFAALSIAMKHPELFRYAVALSGPINVRYWNTKNRYFANFKPHTYVWGEEYNPRMVVGRYFGLVKIRAGMIVDGVFGPPEAVIANATANNPADLLFTQHLRPGQIDFYVNYSSHDNFNFDAHAESFAWLAKQVGISVDLERHYCAFHNMPYFHRSQRRAYEWLSERLPWPTDPAPAAVEPITTTTPPLTIPAKTP